MLQLTLPLSALAYHGSPASHLRLTLTHLSHLALPIKQPYSPFQTETDTVQMRIQVKQWTVISRTQHPFIRNYSHLRLAHPSLEIFDIVYITSVTKL